MAATTAARHAMATRFECVLPGPPTAARAAVLEAALDEVSDCERRLSLFSRGSLLSLVNAEAARRWVAVDGDTFDLLLLCRQVHRASGGAFDPTVAPVLTALGLHRGAIGIGAAGMTPGAAGMTQGNEPARVAGMGQVELDRARSAVRFRDAAVKLDLGAVAKGHALDLAAAVLAEHGVEAALLHGGTSTARALGAPPGRKGWGIALGPEPGAAAVALRQRALSVSAPHGRARPGEAAVHHLIDPRTGTSAGHAATAAVTAERAALADAWSTARAVAGPALALPDGVGGIALRQPSPNPTHARQQA